MNFAALIRQVSRGHPGRGMTPEEACFLFGRILDGFIPDLELGALILALRIRTESVHELLGFHRALVQRSRQMKWKGPFLPVVLPTYNGARHHVNLTPLLALMLQRLDLPVLLHGVHESYGRVTSVRILEKWGIDPAHTLEEAEKQLESRKIAYIEPELVYPGIEQLLNYRTRLGVRNSAHSLVKLMNPFDCPSLRMIAAS
ncbi:MAG: DNA-binding protein YbiB, partial [Pseudomonadota bacterium]|nr:DNA-binding protein YbiB [Pseudomonadota bacterium]